MAAGRDGRTGRREAHAERLLFDSAHLPPDGDGAEVRGRAPVLDARRRAHRRRARPRLRHGAPRPGDPRAHRRPRGRHRPLARDDRARARGGAGGHRVHHRLRRGTRHARRSSTPSSATRPSSGSRTSSGRWPTASRRCVRAAGWPCRRRPATTTARTFVRAVGTLAADPRTERDLGALPHALDVLRDRGRVRPAVHRRRLRPCRRRDRGAAGARDPGARRSTCSSRARPPGT